MSQGSRTVLDPNGPNMPPASPEGRLDILLVGRQPFGGRPPLGDWQMARALARHHRVLVVDPPVVARGRSVRELRRLLTPRVARPARNISLLRPVALPGAARPRTAAASDRLLAQQIRAVSRTLFPRPPIVITFDPLRGTLDAVPRRHLVYWRKDRLAATRDERTAQWLGTRDDDLLRTADLVSCTARTLFDEASAVAAGKVVYIPNGCDTAHFRRPLPRPHGFPAGDGPVLGFIGGAFWRLDGALIEQIARARPGWTLLFVGDAGAPLPSLPNIRRVDYIAYEDVPAWMQHLDVGIIPYDMRLDFNHGSFPIKSLEYLAAGTPVVSTALPALEGMEPFVRRADDTTGFLERCELALSDGPDRAAAQAFVVDQDWSDRAERLTHELLALNGRT